MFARFASLDRVVCRLPAVIVLHWTTGAALTLARPSVAFQWAARLCPVLAVAWLAPLVAPRGLSRDGPTARVLGPASGAAIGVAVAVGAAAWMAGGRGWPPFLSPLEFGERWLSLFR